MRKTIFVVDDNDTNLTMAKEVLKDHYRVMTVPSAPKLFALIKKITPDMILLDIEMPGMDGFEALQFLKNNTEHSDVPVIFLTSMADSSTEVRGFQLGVVDFITKPFSAPVLLNRIKTHLDIDDIIRARTAHLHRLQNGIVYGFSEMVEGRDHETGGHVSRTSAYIEILIKAILDRGMHVDDIRGMNLESLVSSARLHDVGKISIPDSILNKPGKLTDEEFLIMKTHTTEGEQFIDKMISQTGDEEFLRNAKLFAGYHHERWDGKGYPYGLEKIKIPLQGRIMAVVDVYDALVSERPYKKPFEHKKAVEIIMDGKETQFDPELTEVFYEVNDQFKAVKLELT